jgi:hypothetical protein
VQYKQLHGMLPRGLRELDSIFHGGRYSKALAAAGGNIVNQVGTGAPQPPHKPHHRPLEQHLELSFSSTQMILLVL